MAIGKLKEDSRGRGESSRTAEKQESRGYTKPQVG